MGEYMGILALIAVSAGICGLMVIGSWLLGPKKNTPYKSSPYECGVAPAGDARERFPIKFYLVAIVFILFDIEIVFLWPWMAAYRNSGSEFMLGSLLTFLLYMSTFVLAYAYVNNVKALEWDESTSLAPEIEEGTVEVMPEEHTLVGVGGGIK